MFANASSPPQLPLRIVGSRGTALGDVTDGGGSPDNYTLAEGRVRIGTGAYPVYDLRIAYSGFKILAADAGESANANNLTIEAAALELSSSYIQLTFGGQTSTIVPAGAAFILSDPIPVQLPADSFAWVRTAVRVASGQFWPRAAHVSWTGESYKESASVSNQVLGTGALSTPSGGVNSSFGYAPLAIIGRSKTPVPSVLILGDSIGVGDADAATNADYGFIQRGLYGVSAHQIPWTCAARGSETAGTFADATKSARRRALLDYVTHAIIEYPTNDIVGGASLATVKIRMGQIFAACAAKNVKAYAVCIPPRTTSSNSWVDAAGQTAVTNYGIGGIRDQYNTWVKAGADGQIAGYADPGPYWENQAALSKWIDNGTADGIHPASVAHIAAAAAINALAATFAVNSQGYPTA